MDDLRVSPALTIPGAALSWTAARAEGPGGQHVNKTSSKVELRCQLSASEIRPAVLARLHAAKPSWFVGDGELLVVSQKTRSQGRNLADTLERLADALREALVPPTPRRATKPTYGSQLRRLDAKRRDGEKKRDRAGPRED